MCYINKDLMKTSLYIYIYIYMIWNKVSLDNVIKKQLNKLLPTLSGQRRVWGKCTVQLSDDDDDDKKNKQLKI